jgi:hypothetical protein
MHLTGSNSPGENQPIGCTDSTIQGMRHLSLAYIYIYLNPHQQMNTTQGTDVLLPEQFSLVHSLSDTALRAASNRAYLKLEKENFALRDRVDKLQCVPFPV